MQENDQAVTLARGLPQSGVKRWTRQEWGAGTRKIQEADPPWRLDVGVV